MAIEIQETLSYPTRYAAFDSPGTLAVWKGEIEGCGKEIAVFFTDWHCVELHSTEDRHLFSLKVSSGGCGNWTGRVWILDSRIESIQDELEMSIQADHWGLYAVYRGDFESVTIENGQVTNREERAK